MRATREEDRELEAGKLEGFRGKVVRNSSDLSRGKKENRSKRSFRAVLFRLLLDNNGTNYAGLFRGEETFFIFLRRAFVYSPLERSGPGRVSCFETLETR